MEKTAQDQLREVINNPEYNFSKTTKDWMEKLATHLDLYKMKADKWDELDKKISEFYPEGAEDNDDYGDLADIGEIAAIAFGYL